MVSLVLIALVLLLVLFYSQYRALQRNIRSARDSGLKYVVAPSWLPLSLFYRTWAIGYEPFEKQGVDTFIIVSPAGNVMWTCDPDVILQLTARHNDFVKPTEMLGMLNIYGPTITAAEGDEHRRYRKIAAPFLNEDTHQTVWTETISQAQSMLEHWNCNKGVGVVPDVNVDANRFALHVLSKAFFNRPMAWDDKTVIPPGHKLSYSKAISTVFKNYSTLFMIPKPVLKISPAQEHKLCLEAYDEFKIYMEEMVADEKQHIASTQDSSDNDNLLQNFVKASQSPDTETQIPDAAVFGNLFIFTLAGHETSANTLTFALSLLACRPDFQAALHADINDILGARRDTPASWTYPQDYSRLMDGHIGALMNETIRLYTVLPFIPKTNPSVQSLTVDGNKHILAANTLAIVNTSAVHRHPKYWLQPSSSPTKAAEGPPYALSSFRPEFWLNKQNVVPGSFVPFAEGFRSCLGTRFAKVEFCAAVATICAEFEVQLIGGTDTEAIKAGARRISQEVKFEMGLKPSDAIGLRFVKRR
ncbi:cytochrome P450 [Periconia macrospinosa]|uniref:Cytochrome P450 n=1 Tax=Periconia macrospinosa TaxID=97972 RepID=A0A2V1EDH8_9PLEO|nr:cytochrome P450 [Periconia macrospinosa]